MRGLSVRCMPPAMAIQHPLALSGTACTGPLLSSLLCGQTSAKYGIGLVFTKGAVSTFIAREDFSSLGLGKQDVRLGLKGLD